MAGLAVGIAVLAWPIPFRLPLSDYFAWGLDFSWQIALHLAAIRGLRWGSDVLFTYGPLGFLCVPVVGLLVSAWTSALGLGFVGALVTSLAAALLLSLRRWLPLPLAWVGALLAAALLGGSIPEMGAFLGLLVLGLAMGDALGPRATALAPALVAALASVLLLVKASAGIALAFAVPFGVLAERDAVLRRGGAAAAAFAGALALAWLCAGQPLAGLPAWLHGAALLAGGYSEAMASEDPLRRWESAAFSLAALALALAFAIGVERRPPRRVAAVAGLLAASGLVFFKAGFVRHVGADHSPIAFAFLLIAPLLVPWRASWRIAGLALALGGGLLLGLARGAAIGQTFDFAARASALLHEVAAVAHPQTRSAIETAVRTGIRRSAKLPPNALAELQGRRVHVDPHDVAILWAYGLDWSPVPVFQAYAAYVPALDRMNAERLADPSGPERILRRRLEESIDGKSPVWETPEYALVRLCRFRETVAGELWQVLARGPDRCGPEQALGDGSARSGESVDVPPASAPDRIVVARLDASPLLAGRLRALLFKPRRPLALRVGDRRLRLVRANLAGPLLLRVPPTSGWSPAFDGGLAIESFALEGADAPIAVRFAEIALAP